MKKVNITSTAIILFYMIESAVFFYSHLNDEAIHGIYYVVGYLLVCLGVGVFNIIFFLITWLIVSEILSIFISNHYNLLESFICNKENITKYNKIEQISVISIMVILNISAIIFVLNGIINK